MANSVSDDMLVGLTLKFESICKYQPLSFNTGRSIHVNSTFVYPNYPIGVNRPAIMREIPHFGLFPTFPHFCENVPHFWLYFEITKISENCTNFSCTETFCSKKRSNNINDSIA